MTYILIILWTTSAFGDPRELRYTFESEFMCQRALAVVLASGYAQEARCEKKEPSR